MTNFEKWRAYTDRLPTPDNMIDWAWVSLIGSCLQRRVWLGVDYKPIYANNYIFLVSDPGIGKSLVLDDLKTFVKHWHVGDNATQVAMRFQDIKNREMAQMVVESAKDRQDKIAQGETEKQGDFIKPVLIPVASDATSYEALILAFGKCYNLISYPKIKEDGTEGIGNIGHASLCFILPELRTLLAEKVSKTVTFLLGLYDCPTDFEYDTISRKKDRIRRGCLNIIGGTNQNQVNIMLEDKLIDPAFLSRTLFIFASKERKTVSKIPRHTAEEIQIEHDIQQHILKLTTLYGSIHEEPETDKWIHDWFVEHKEFPERRASQHPKMIHYYSRKLLHMKKTAIALHFGESTEMCIPLETYQRAAAMLKKEEKFMHLALVLEAKDKPAQMVNHILRACVAPVDYVSLYTSIHEQLGYVDKKSFEEAIEFLLDTNQIRAEEMVDKDTGETIKKWRIK